MMIEFTFRQHYFHPWSFWRARSSACKLNHARKDGRFALSLVALLNRETSVFLLVAFFCIELPRGPQAFVAIANLAAVGGRQYLALHAVVGYALLTFFIATAIEGNRANLWFADR